MKIRDAVEKDLPAIVDIYNAAIPERRACGYIEPVSVESRQSWYQQHPPDRRPIWVMEIEDKIVGWLSLQFFVGTPAYHATAEISIYIDPNYKRMGIGKKLVEKAIGESSNCGIKTLIALIFAHNVPSLKLFERLGFQRWGYLPRVAEIDNVERDVAIMGLRVDEL